MQSNIFENSAARESLVPGALLLRDFLGGQTGEIMSAIGEVANAAPFRHMSTPGGFRMSVAMTNCGPLGWVTDRKGYRYSPIDPESGRGWPPMPALFETLANRAAALANYLSFQPDACLINRYAPSSRMTLHQDRDETDMTAPIVSFSLGLPATFLFGGLTRKERPIRYNLLSGDVVVWGGPSRLNFHGVAALKPGEHPLTGQFRYNLTFRKALG